MYLHSKSYKSVYICAFAFHNKVMIIFFYTSNSSLMLQMIKACHIRQIFITSSSSHLHIDIMLQDAYVHLSFYFIHAFIMSYSHKPILLIMFYMHVTCNFHNFIQNMFLGHENSQALIMYRYLICMSIMLFNFHHASHTFLIITFSIKHRRQIYHDICFFPYVSMYFFILIIHFCLLCIHVRDHILGQAYNLSIYIDACNMCLVSTFQDYFRVCIFLCKSLSLYFHSLLLHQSIQVFYL